MAHRIEIRGPLRYVVLGLVVLFIGSNWLAPDLLAGLSGSGGRSWRLLRSGHIERYHRNLTDHWITAEKGSYRTGLIPVLAGENVIVDFEVDQIEGSVGIALVRYEWGFWPDFVWSEGIRQDQTGRFQIPASESGLYGLRISYYVFAGDVAFDWRVD